MFEVIDIGSVKTVTAKKEVNHVYVVDCSYSMSRSLPQMRDHLKNIVSLVTNAGDTFTLIYFSGKDECGTIFKEVPVESLRTVEQIKNSIDRFIRPIGLTAFVDPIVEACEVASEFTNNNPNNFVMLTDGYDNTYDKGRILGSVTKLPFVYDNCTFIEYGWYADRELIQQMAQTTGGIHLFSEGIENYTSTVNTALGAKVSPKIEVRVNKRAKNIIYINNNAIVIADAKNGIAEVNEGVDKVYSIMPNDVETKTLSELHRYLVLYYGAKTNNSKLVWSCLSVLGDIHLVDMYTNAFTKLELQAFVDSCEKAVFDEGYRYLKGQNDNYVPKKNAKTIVDLLTMLSSAGAKLMTHSPTFEYNRIGRKSEVIENNLPKFVPGTENGYDISGTSFNSSRPNISLKVNQEGSVMLPANDHGLSYVESKRWKSFTIVKDGILNMKNLPVTNKDKVLQYLDENGIQCTEISPEIVDIDLTGVPLINRASVENISSTQYSMLVSGILRLQAEQKVIKYYIGELSGSSNKTDGLVETYGAEVATWLNEQGVRDSGFSPTGTKLSDSHDQYEAVEISCKIAKFSSLPSVNAVNKKLDSGKKLTASETLVNHYLRQYADADIKALKLCRKGVETNLRNLQSTLASINYGLLLGKTWFSGEDSNVDSGTYGGRLHVIDLDIKFTVAKNRVVIKI